MARFPRWAKVAGIVAFLAALLTVIVLSRQIITDWLWPRNTSIELGTTWIDFFDYPFHWPSTYDGAPDEHKRFFESSQHFVKIRVLNASNFDLSELTLLLPSQAVIEIRDEHNVVKRAGIADNFKLGPIAPNKTLIVSIWTIRPIIQDEFVTLMSSGATERIKATRVISAADIRFYQNGFYALLGITLLLVITTFLLALRIYRPRAK